MSSIGLLSASALAIAVAPGVLPADAFKALMPLATLRPYDKNVDCKFIVLAKPLDVHNAKEGGTVYTFLIADDSASMLATFWDEQGGALKAGDIILLRGGLVTLYKGHLRLACKRMGSLVKIDRFKMHFTETPNVSDILWIPDPAHPDKLIPSGEEFRANLNSQEKTKSARLDGL